MSELEPMDDLVLIDKIAKAISKMRDEELGAIFNNFHVKTSIGTHIYSIDDFDEAFADIEPLDIASAVENSNFDSYLPFFYIDEHLNGLTSIDGIYADEEPVKEHFDELVSYVVYCNDPLGNPTLAKILEENPLHFENF